MACVPHEWRRATSAYDSQLKQQSEKTAATKQTFSEGGREEQKRKQSHILRKTPSSFAAEPAGSKLFFPFAIYLRMCK